MGFLFPLFLLAGLALVIPVLIHLFNLRRYKRVLFPDTRFLRNLQLSTKRQSRLRDRRLLALRLLFLAALILAFAQPYFSSSGNDRKQASVTAIYIDNSYSMTIGEGQENLLQQARNQARQLIGASAQQARFVLLSNDRLSAGRPMLRNEALEALDEIHPVARSVSLRQVMTALSTAQQNERHEQWSVYIFSDLQQDIIPGKSGQIPELAHTRLYFYPLSAPNAANLYIDTAWFLSPNLDTRQPNPLVVRVKHSGAGGERKSNLRLSVGGQVRAVSTIDIKDGDEWTDTLALQLNTSGWQEISLSLEDRPLSFDDTFRIAARTTPDLSVLVVGEGSINPYLQAALRTYDGFRLQQQDAGALRKEDWPQHTLVVLQNIGTVTPALTGAVKEALQRGQNVLLFPGDIHNLAAYNQALSAWGAISLGAADTSRQQVVTLQQAHPLMHDLFEKVPDNVQLPLTLKRYPIEASVGASQQSLMSFRDGRPFLAQYSLYQGKLYLSASSLDDRSSNFAVSYFFVPLLYKMAVQGSGGNMYAFSVGESRPLWLPVQGADDRKVWHLAGRGIEAIPSQRPSGVGVELFLNQAVQDAGFYHLCSEASRDSVLVGVNAARSESLLRYVDRATVESAVRPMKVRWLNGQEVVQHGWDTAGTSFPVWKICVVVALLCLAGETFMLLRRRRQSREAVSA